MLCMQLLTPVLYPLRGILFSTFRVILACSCSLMNCYPYCDVLLNNRDETQERPFILGAIEKRPSIETSGAQEGSQ
jgi:hypothetical protein